MYQDAEDRGSNTAHTRRSKRQIKRSTVAQIKALVEYMSRHTQLARLKCNQALADREWQRLAETLNRSGTVKSVESWKHTWRDLRRRAAKDQEEVQATRTSLNELSKKILEIMADSDEELVEKSNNTCLSPTQSISIHSAAEESDQEQDIESNNAGAEGGIEVSAKADARASPASELESIIETRDTSTDNSPCSSPIPNKRRCTHDQINTLVDCMAINTSMAFGKPNTAKNAEDWQRLRQFLNKMGPAKRTLAWQKTWRDLKRSAVVTSQTKSPSMKPTTKKILDIIRAHKPQSEDDHELSGDDSDLLIQENETSFRANSKSPLGEYLILPAADGKRRDSGKLVSPRRRSSNNMPVLDYSYELYDDSEAEYERSQTVLKMKKQRCTDAQKFAIVEYMAQHPDVAVSRASDPDYYYKWRQLSQYLNSVGTAKTTVSWKRTWRELKKNARLNRASKHKMAQLNKKILKICGNSASPRQSKSDDETLDDNELTDDMPLRSLRRQSDAEHTTPEKVDSEENLNDVTEYNQDANSEAGVSPERDSMSPDQQKRNGKKKQSPKLKNGRCTPAQITALLEYMAQHPSLAQAKCLYMPKARDPRHDEWRRLTGYLNRLNKKGPAKSTMGWKVTWRSLCLNARRKKSVQCPSYEKVYKKVLKILSQPLPKEDGATDKKVESIEDDDPPRQSSEHNILADPLNCEETKNKSQAGQMSPGRLSPDISRVQRGSRMSPVRISDRVAAERKSNMSPGNSGKTVKRLNRVSSMDRDTNLGEEEDELNASKEQWRMKPRKMRSSNDQLRALTDYMIAHPDLATGKYKHREYAWLRLTKYLNDMGPARKRVVAWRRTWRDIKNGVRSRVRGNQRSSCLRSFRERRLLKLIGMTSLEKNNGQDDDHMDEEYVIPEPEVILSRSTPSPHSARYSLDSLARSPRRAHSERERLMSAEEREQKVQANETNRLLKMLLQEVRRSNELNVEQNEYLKEILKELRTQNCTNTASQADRDSPVDQGNSMHVQKQEVLENTIDVQIQEEDNSDCGDHDLDVKIPISSSPAIRPVALTTLTRIKTKQPCDLLKVQSILQSKFKPVSPKGKLVRLKDGTMVLLSGNSKTHPEIPDKNGGNQINDQKTEENEDDLWQMKANVNEC